MMAPTHFFTTWRKTGARPRIVQEASRSRGPLEQGRRRLAQVHATRQRTGSRVQASASKRNKTEAPRLPTGQSGDHFANHVVFLDTCEALIEPERAVGQFFVIQTKQVKKGCVEIVHMNRPVGDSVAQFIGPSMNVSRFHSASGHPDRESFLVVITANVAVLLACPIASLSHGRTTEFSAPDYESLVKQAPLLEVLDQSRIG